MIQNALCQLMKWFEGSLRSSTYKEWKILMYKLNDFGKQAINELLRNPKINTQNYWTSLCLKWIWYKIANKMIVMGNLSEKNPDKKYLSIMFQNLLEVCYPKICASRFHIRVGWLVYWKWFRTSSIFLEDKIFNWKNVLLPGRQPQSHWSQIFLNIQ